MNINDVSHDGANVIYNQDELEEMKTNVQQLSSAQQRRRNAKKAKELQNRQASDVVQLGHAATTELGFGSGEHQF